MVSLIGLTGHKRAGKDEVAKILLDYGFVRVALADPLKSLAAAIGWNGSKENLEPCPHCGMMQGRQLLQVLGTEGVRHIIDDAAWLKVAYRESQKYAYVVVPDIRFVNEADWIWDNGGVIWRVERPGYEGDSHSSETEMEVITEDATIYNDGTLDDLAYEVETLVSDEGRAYGESRLFLVNSDEVTY